MWLKSPSAAILLCGLLLSTPVFAQGREALTATPTDPQTTIPILSSASTESLSSATADPTFSPPPTPPSSRLSGNKTSSTRSSGAAGGKTNVGAIAGGVVGGLVALALIALGIFLFMRRRRKRENSFELEKSPPASAAPRTSSPSAPASLPPPQQQPIGPHEEHALMSHYGESQPQNISPHPGDSAPQMMYTAGEVIPVVGAPKPHALPSSREIEDDEISFDDPPSPSATPNPERQQQRSVPRLPMYQSSRDDQSTTPGL